MKKMSLLALLVTVTNTFSFEITEQSLIEMAKNTQTPSMDMIEATYLEATEALASVNDSLRPSLFGGYNHRETNERAMVPFMPVFSNINTYQVGAQKNFKYGLSTSVTATLDERSGSSASQRYKDINTLIYSFNVSMDLWQDLLGRLTQAKIENASLIKKNAELKKKIEQNSFILAVRRIYWQLVSINEKLVISKALYKQSQEQASDARKRQRSNIADRSEVARYESQVYTRKATILILEYQSEALLKELRNLLPKLKEQEVKLGKYEVEANVNSVLECTAIIATQRETPYEFTKYDEISERLAKIEANQFKIDDSLDDVDIKLTTNIFSTGLGSESKSTDFYEGSHALAQEDLSDHDRSGVEAGISINIPIGTNRPTVAEVRKVYNQKRFKAERENLNNNLQNTHMQLASSVKLLAQVVQTQKDNSEKLGIRLKDMKQKFNQARISVNDLINDQDAKMNSDLAIIDSRLAVVNVILDYFSIFSETPCSFNRK